MHNMLFLRLADATKGILEQKSEKSEIFSDLQGIFRLQFFDDVQEKTVMIKRELENIGII